MKNFSCIAARRMDEYRLCSAFHVRDADGSILKGRKLNQFACDYTFSDGSVLRINSKKQHMMYRHSATGYHMGVSAMYMSLGLYCPELQIY